MTRLGPRALLDQGAPPEGPERVVGVGAEQVAQRALGEGVAEDSGVLERPLLLGRELIDPRCDRGLHGVGERPRGGVGACIADPARDLLGEERIAARGVRDPGRVGSAIVGEKQFGEVRCGVAIERQQLELGVVARRATELRAALGELGPAGAEHQDRRVVQAVGDVLEQLEGPLVSPVGVVHSDRQRPVAREQGHEPAPGAAELLLGVAVRPSPDGDGQAGCQRGSVLGAELGQQLLQRCAPRRRAARPSRGPRHPAGSRRAPRRRCPRHREGSGRRSSARGRDPSGAP